MSSTQSTAQPSDRSLTGYITYLQEHKLQFAQAIGADWKATMFENRYTIHPRRIRELGELEIDGLVQFLETRQTGEAFQRGTRRAEEGLGIRSVLALGTRFRQISLQRGSPAERNTTGIITLIDTYMGAYLSGFVAAREQYVLDEQERLRKAYLTVITGRQQGHS